MIPDQKSEQPRHKRILHAVMAAEDSLSSLLKNPERQALRFNAAAYQMTAARNLAQEYYLEAAKLPQDKTSFPDHRSRLLNRLETAIQHLNLVQENIVEDVEIAAILDPRLSDVFQFSVRRCSKAIADANDLISNTVLEGRYLIGSQQSQNNIVNAIRANKPAPEKAVTKPDWIRLAVSNPAPDLR